MIAKALMGSASPIELLRYVFRAEKTPSVVSSNMCGPSPPRLSAEFADVMALRPDIRKPLAHFVLSAPPGVRLGDEQWDQRVRIFLQKMGLDSDKNLFLAARHSDSGTDHVHCLVLRVGIDSAIWYGRWAGRQAVKAANEITLFFGEEPVVSRAVKALSRAERQMVARTAVQAPRRVIQDALAVVLTDKPTLDEFTSRLENLGVRALANVANTGRINGVSFEYAGVPFKGSQLGRRYRWAELSAKLDLAPQQERLGSDVSLEPRLAARTAQVATAAPPPQDLSVPTQVSNDSPGLKSRPPPRIPPPWENRRKNTEGELPPHLRGLGPHGLDDMPSLGQLPSGMTPWELTKTNQYNRLCRSAPQILAPQERSKTHIDGGLGQPDPVISQTAKVQPSVALTGLAPPPGELIDHYQGRWVVRTKSEVLFSDHLVNDVALRKGFEAAAKAYGSHLQLRNIDGQMLDRAVNVIARTRSLRMVTFDRAEDQEKLASARLSFEQAQKRDLAEKQKREATALADRQDAERRRQRERHLEFIERTRETRLKRRKAERAEAAVREAERVEQARLDQERFDRAQPLRELKARIAELADEIGTECRALEDNGRALKASLAAAEERVRIARADPELTQLLTRLGGAQGAPLSPSDAKRTINLALRVTPAELRERLGLAQQYEDLKAAWEPFKSQHQKVLEASNRSGPFNRVLAAARTNSWNKTQGPSALKALEDFDNNIRKELNRRKPEAWKDLETLDRFNKAHAASGVEGATGALEDFKTQLPDAMQEASQRDARRREEVDTLRLRLSEMERLSEPVEGPIATPDHAVAIKTEDVQEGRGFNAPSSIDYPVNVDVQDDQPGRENRGVLSPVRDGQGGHDGPSAGVGATSPTELSSSDRADMSPAHVAAPETPTIPQSEQGPTEALEIEPERLDQGFGIDPPSAEVVSADGGLNRDGPSRAGEASNGEAPINDLQVRTPDAGPETQEIASQQLSQDPFEAFIVRNPAYPAIKVSRTSLARALGWSEGGVVDDVIDVSPEIFGLSLEEQVAGFARMAAAEERTIEQWLILSTKAVGNGSAKAKYTGYDFEEILRSNAAPPIDPPAVVEVVVEPKIIVHEPKIDFAGGRETSGWAPGQVSYRDGTITHDASTKVAKPASEAAPQGKSKSRSR